MSKGLCVNSYAAISKFIYHFLLHPYMDDLQTSVKRLKEAFEARLRSDPELAADPRARLQWLYARTPYHDDRYRLYPVGRE